MKKLLSLLLCLALAALCATALAEPVGEWEDVEPETYAPDPDSLAFEGLWVCGRASIEISAEDAGFKCSIAWADSAAVVVEWEYACMYDADAGALVDVGMGVKTIVTYGEGGVVVDADEQYNDGTATFTLNPDGTLAWLDGKENAGEDMAFERTERYDFSDGFGGGAADCFIDGDGHFIVQIAVAEGDPGQWQADDMAQVEDAVVALYYADTLEDTFVANYAPTGEGMATVSARHATGPACDEVYTWALEVAGGRVASAVNSGWTTSPDADYLDSIVSGQWVEPVSGLFTLTVARNPGGGWDATVLDASGDTPHLYAFTAWYDCELDDFVYVDGAAYEATYTGGEPQPGALVRDGLAGNLATALGEGGSPALEWYDAFSGATIRFSRT